MNNQNTAASTTQICIDEEASTRFAGLLAEYLKKTAERAAA